MAYGNMAQALMAKPGMGPMIKPAVMPPQMQTAVMPQTQQPGMQQPMTKPMPAAPMAKPMHQTGQPMPGGPATSGPIMAPQGGGMQGGVFNSTSSPMARFAAAGQNYMSRFPFMQQRRSGQGGMGSQTPGGQGTNPGGNSRSPGGWA